jgi:hypothetical protein
VIPSVVSEAESGIVRIAEIASAGKAVQATRAEVIRKLFATSHFLAVETGKPLHSGWQ